MIATYFFSFFLKFTFRIERMMNDESSSDQQHWLMIFFRLFQDVSCFDGNFY